MLPQLARAPRGVVFDLDGTLVNTLVDIAHGVNAVMAARGAEPATVAEVQGWVGDGVRVLLGRALSARGFGGDAAAVAEALPIFLADYGAHLLDTTATYPGVRELLAALRDAGIVMAVVSNKPEALTQRVVAGLELAPFFPVQFGGDSFPTRKPAPEPVLAALQRLDVSPADAVMVGDGVTDIEAARAAGVLPISVSWGFKRVEVLRQAGAAGVIHHPAQLLSIWE